jgi:hypothetical protein
MLTATGQMTQTQYKIRYSSNYLRVNYGSPGSTTSASSAATFYTDVDGYFYTLYNGNVVYLTLSQSTSSSNYYTSVNYSTTIDTAGFKKSGNYLVADYGGTTWYLRQYGASAYQDSYYGTSYTFTTSTVNVSIDRSLSFSSNNSYTASKFDASYTTQSTYFPLNFDTTSTSKVSSKNTGYVVAGAYEDSGIQADIRVSQYTIDDISNSTSSSSSTTVDSSKVYTINASGSGTISDTSAY